MERLPVEIVRIRQLMDQMRWEEAKALAVALVRQSDNVEVRPVNSDKSRRWELIADAEECLAAIAYSEGDYSGVVSHAQQCIFRSERFRTGVQLISALAQRQMGDIDLAVSKLEIVQQHSPDAALGTFAGTVRMEIVEASNGGQ